MLIAVPERGRERQKSNERARAHDLSCNSTQKGRERERVSLQVLKTVSE